MTITNRIAHQYIGAGARASTRIFGLIGQVQITLNSIVEELFEFW